MRAGKSFRLRRRARFHSIASPRAQRHAAARRRGSRRRRDERRILGALQRDRTDVRLRAFGGSAASPLLARRAYRVWRPLDVEAMRAAAAPCSESTISARFARLRPRAITVRDVRRLEIERRGNLVRVEIAADGFLHRWCARSSGRSSNARPDGVAPGDAVGARRAAIARLPDTPHRRRGSTSAGVRYDDGYDSFAEPPLFRWGGAVIFGSTDFAEQALQLARLPTLSRRRRRPAPSPAVRNASAVRVVRRR